MPTQAPKTAQLRAAGGGLEGAISGMVRLPAVTSRFVPGSFHYGVPQLLCWSQLAADERAAGRRVHFGLKVADLAHLTQQLLGQLGLLALAACSLA